MFFLYSRIKKFLIENNITEKFDPFSYCKNKNIKLIKYTKNNLQSLKQISADGFSIYQDNEFYIFYNPYQNKGRVNFTLAHEIGHIYLYHHFLLPSDVLLKSNNFPVLWEKQANIFARNVLIPVDSLHAKKIKGNINNQTYKDYCVSEKMFYIRCSQLSYDERMFRIIKNKF